ncbi:MAG: PQQ-like beta-propeller repeat protein [Planctomycetia bacterium]|nr:PQQ-like beta-propeller repeat protein [Planctomycetia bacterium]
MMRRGKASSWFIVVLLFAGFIGLGWYHRAYRLHYQANQQLLQEVQAAPLVSAEEPPLGSEGDWPQWRGRHRDGLSRETGLLSTWPARGPTVVWQVPIGLGYSSMAVADGKLFTQFQEGEQEVAVCLDASTGQELWRRAYPGKYRTDPAYGPCPRATPAVDGERVYLVSGGGLALCLAVADGKELWKKDLLADFAASLPKWGVASSPLLVEDAVIVQPGGPGAALAALNRYNGSPLWHAHDDPAGYSSPLVATLAGRRQIVHFSGDSLLSVSPAGALLWRFPWETSHHCNAATPIVRGDYVFISSSYGKGCALVKVTPSGAEAVYETNEMCNHFASSILVGEHLYGFSDSILKCLDFRTGQPAWTKRGLGKGSLLAADGKLIILGENGYLCLANATPAGYEELASFRFSSRRCWSAPVLAQGKLYVRDTEKLVCYALK